MKGSVFRIMIALIIFTGLEFAQQSNQIKFDMGKTIQEICSKIEKFYPNHELAKEISNNLLHEFQANAYSSLTNPEMFAERIKNDIVRYSNDVHFNLKYDPELAKKMKEEMEIDTGFSDKEWTKKMVEDNRPNNYGFKKLEILDGNIGYLKMDVFFSPKYAGDVAVASMNFFSNCDAIIIDLADNTGGWGEMGMFILSYFVDEDEALTMDIHHSTIDNSYQTAVSYSYVPGRKYTDIPIYLLVSKRTASAAEGFAYRMRYLNRATIIGGKTAGAETPVELLPIEDNFILQIPCYETIYSIEGPGWQGKGVMPDIEADKESAVYIAEKEFVTSQLTKKIEQSQKLKYEWILESIEANLIQLTKEDRNLNKYVGQYSKRKIFIKKESLFYQNDDGPEFELVQMRNDLFQFKVTKTIRVNFIMENDISKGFLVKYDDGYKTKIFMK